MDEYQQRANDCLQRMQSANGEVDKWTWKIMSDSWLLLRKFRLSAEQELSTAKREVKTLQDYIATKRDARSKIA